MRAKDEDEYEFFRIEFPNWDLIRILRMLKNFEAKHINVYYQDDKWKMTFYAKKPQGIFGLWWQKSENEKRCKGAHNQDNEWNFIKDGKFPEENTECLCIIRPIKEKDEPFGNKDFRAVLFYRNKKFYLEENNDNDSSLIYADSDYSELVVAWKEIILPKENDYYILSK